MRDRLIELHRNAFLHLLDTEKPFTHANYADFLLANGVIVPPCKVGQTVYVIIDMDNPARRMLECKVISISIEEASIYFQFKTFKEYLYRYGMFNIDDIGKTVFLTREEAEQALKEAQDETEA